MICWGLIRRGQAPLALGPVNPLNRALPSARAWVNQRHPSDERGKCGAVGGNEELSVEPLKSGGRGGFMTH